MTLQFLLPDASSLNACRATASTGCSTEVSVSLIESIPAMLLYLPTSRPAAVNASASFTA